MANNKIEKIHQDDSLEHKFVMDYAAFGLRINFEAVAALYEKAQAAGDIARQKSICLVGLQLMFSSWEDFALLLQGFMKRKRDGVPLDRFLRNEGQKHGTSNIPRVFQHYQSARQMLDELGFESINHRMLTRYYLSQSKSYSTTMFRGFIDHTFEPYRRSMSRDSA